MGFKDKSSLLGLGLKAWGLASPNAKTRRSMFKNYTYYIYIYIYIYYLLVLFDVPIFFIIYIYICIDMCSEFQNNNIDGLS